MTPDTETDAVDPRVVAEISQLLTDNRDRLDAIAAIWDQLRDGVPTSA